MPLRTGLVSKSCIRRLPVAYSAKIIRDSIGHAAPRLTTFEVTFPRIVHAEMMTHRAFSRNAGSSRAIPIEKMIDRILADPFYPIEWGTNKPGMQAGEEIANKEIAEDIWQQAALNAIQSARYLAAQGVHKQLANRLLEPFSWITVIITATEWANFFTQRCHPDAQPEIRKIAEMMRDLYYSNTPTELADGEYHTPYIQPDEEGLEWEVKIKISVARCARVSYLTHDGTRSVDKDIDLYDKLINGGANGHWSPFEHVAMVEPKGLIAYTGYGSQTLKELSGNFAQGWAQFRKEFIQECATEYVYES